MTITGGLVPVWFRPDEKAPLLRVGLN